MTEHSIQLLLSSSSNNGAYSISSGHDKYEIDLKRPITIDKKATQCTVETVSCQVPWTVCNVVTGTNDKFQLNYNDGKVINPEEITKSRTVVKPLPPNLIACKMPEKPVFILKEA